MKLNTTVQKISNLFIILMFCSFFAIAGDPFRVDENLEMGLNDVYNATNINATNFYGTLSGSITIGENLDMNSYDINETTRIIFNISGCTDSTPEGIICWDSVDKTIRLVTGWGNVIQIGQEMFGVGVNKEGSTVDDGQVVYLSGSTGFRPEFKLADSSNSTMVGSVGVMTAPTCANNEECPVTTFGLVRDFDTSAWVEGNKLYVSSDGSGNLTTTAPTFPNYVVWVATVIRSHATLGIIFVNPSLDHTNGVTLNSLGVINSIQTNGEFIGTLNGSNVANMDLTCGADTYFTALNFTDESATCTAISDVYLLNSGDTATGDYNFDSNTFVIDSTNNYVGIGTSSPTNDLTLGNGLGSEIFSINKGSTSSAQIQFKDGSGETLKARLLFTSTEDLQTEMIRNTADYYITMNTTGAGSTDVFRIDTTGDDLEIMNVDVGIGTTDPIYLTEIKTATNGEAILFVTEDTSTNNDDKGKIILGGGSIPFADFTSYRGASFSDGGLRIATKQGGVMVNHTIFDENGFLGIGIIPESKLHIYEDSTSGATIILQNTEGKYLVNTNNGDLTWFEDSNTIYKYDGGLSTHTFTGNVGIGATPSLGQLHITNADLIRGVLVQQTAETNTPGLDVQASTIWTGSGEGGSLVNMQLTSASATGDLLNLFHAGSGRSEFIDHNSEAVALEIDSEATSAGNAGILVVTGQGAKAARFATDEATNRVDLSRDKTDSTARNWFYGNDALATTAGPLAFFENDNAGDDQVPVQIQSDGDAGHIRMTPKGTAPTTCTIGDIYFDSSGAFCACTATNTWSNTVGTGTCV